MFVGNVVIWAEAENSRKYKDYEKKLETIMNKTL